MNANGLSTDERWWFQKLVDGRLLPAEEAWPDEVLSATLADDFAIQTRRQKYTRRGIETALGKLLRKVCPLIRNDRHAPRPGEDREKYYGMPTLEEARQCWAAGGKPAPWES